jgi:hypothetical protein
MSQVQIGTVGEIQGKEQKLFWRRWQESSKAEKLNFEMVRGRFIR